jgi:glycosyltransferase involved in cell wall biosynthesis
MHICFVCNEFPPAPHGGTGSSYHDLALGLVQAGHNVTVVGVYAAEATAALASVPCLAALRIVRLKGFPTWLPHQMGMICNRWQLKQWLVRDHRQHPFDLIEASDYGGWLCSGGPTGVATVTRIRGSNLFFDQELGRRGNRFEHRLERQGIVRARHLGAVSRYAATRTLAYCGQSERNCTVLYNAVDTKLFAPAVEDCNERGLVVFVNSLNPKKGIEQLLDAMNLVFRKHSHARLAVVGPDTQKADGGRSYASKLRGRVIPEFRDRVEFTGRQNRQTGVVSYLQRAQVCCLPSHMETFGIAAVEAMAVGKPTIYSRTGPGPEVIEDGVSGLLCDPFDPEDIATKICTLLENPTLAAKLGQGARARVIARFNKKDWVSRNLDYYRQSLEHC